MPHSVRRLQDRRRTVPPPSHTASAAVQYFRQPPWTAKGLCIGRASYPRDAAPSARWRYTPAPGNRIFRDESSPAFPHFFPVSLSYPHVPFRISGSHAASSFGIRLRFPRSHSSLSCPVPFSGGSVSESPSGVFPASVLLLQAAASRSPSSNSCLSKPEGSED